MKVESITILGGGTSAWMTAAFLLENHPTLKITIVDKEQGTPIGVGEGTLLRFNTFIEQCGMKWSDVFRECSATFKNGILFKNWQEHNTDIWHPFTLSPYVESEDQYTYTLIDIWTNHQDFDFKRYGTGTYDMSMDYKVPRNLDTAYHVNCGKLVQYLKTHCINKGVEFINSEMITYSRKDNSIHSITLKNNEIIYADLFVDCTGFNCLLNSDPVRVDLSDRLFVNTAIAGQIPYQNKELEMAPYILSEAVDHGWIWTIPVKERMGSGLVFNRNITSIDEAKKYYLNYWNDRISEDNVKVINWDPYYNKNMWHENVVSIGLSAGFVEPLESTGIALIIEGIYQMSNRIKDGFYREIDRDIFNSTMLSFFEESVDFINMHYYNNKRQTPFWKYVKESYKLSDKHKRYIDYMKNYDSSLEAIVKDGNFFTASNWYIFLAQMNETIKPRKYVNTGFDRSRKCLTSWKQFQQNLPKDHHTDLLKRLYKI